MYTILERKFEGFWSTLTILPKRSRLKRKLMKYPLGKIVPKSKPHNSPSNLLDGKYIEILDNPFKWQYPYDTTCSFKVLKTFRHVSLSKFLTSFNLLDGLKLARERCLTWKRLGKTIRFEEWRSWLRGKTSCRFLSYFDNFPFTKYILYALRCSYERCGDCVPACRQSALAGNILRFVIQRAFEITALVDFIDPFFYFLESKNLSALLIRF